MMIREDNYFHASNQNSGHGNLNWDGIEFLNSDLSFTFDSFGSSNVPFKSFFQILKAKGKRCRLFDFLFMENPFRTPMGNNR